MARQNEEFPVLKGPSKLDLMLSLFDTDMGLRIVEFRTEKSIFKVHIISVRRECVKVNLFRENLFLWNIEGIIDDDGKNKSIFIYNYRSDTRDGKMKIEE